MNRYQDEDWQQEEQRRREAYYQMNSQNSNTPDALEQIFRGPLNWMNLLMIGINVVIFIIMEFLGSTEDTGFMLQWGAACRPFILNGEWYRLFTSMFLHFGIYHLANNMAVLLFMGDMVENAVGHWKYLAIYLGSGLVGNLLSLYMDIQSQSNIVSAGASGAIYGIIGGVFVLMIKNKKQVREIVIRRLVFVIVVTIYYRENRYWNQNIPQYTPGLFPRLPVWKTEADNVWLFPWFLRFRTLPTPDRHTALSSRR